MVLMILVTGATGSVGRHVVDELLLMGVPVRAVTRNINRAVVSPHAELLLGGLHAGETFDDWFEDVEAAYFMIPPSLYFNDPALPVEVAQRFVAAAAGKVRQIVMLSAAVVQDHRTEQADVIARVHADVEAIIQLSKIPATYLRPGTFASNAIRWWGQQIRAGDTVRWPFGAALTAPIDERDVASVAAEALADSDGQYTGVKYILTGPEAMTLSEQVRIIGEVIGRPLQFEELPREIAFQQFSKHLPADIANFMLESLADAVVDPPLLTTTVTELTGKPARTFMQWARDNADAFGCHTSDGGPVSVAEVL
jgi:uncharacterized protein YbjT (DUF2867 family)